MTSHRPQPRFREVALKALKTGEICGYPEYSTALTSFYDTAPEDVPDDADEAFDQTQDESRRTDSWPSRRRRSRAPTRSGILTSKADELGVRTISDLEGKSQDLKLYGSPECRQRVDCLVGLEDNYGLEFAQVHAGRHRPALRGARQEAG